MKLADFNADGMISQLANWIGCCQYVRGDMDADQIDRLGIEAVQREKLRLIKSLAKNMADTAKDLAEITE